MTLTSEKAVKAIRQSINRSTLNNRLRKRLGSNTNVTLRVYLADESYRNLRVPLETTVAMVRELVMAKLNIAGSMPDQYGLYECTKGGGRLRIGF